MGGNPLVYLDSAATPRSRAVIEAEADFYRQHNANAHRGSTRWARRRPRRTKVRAGGRSVLRRRPIPRAIVFTRGMTESINLVAHGWGRTFLREGDEILLTEMEHHSNIVPWQMRWRSPERAALHRADRRRPPRPVEPRSLLTERTKTSRSRHVQRARARSPRSGNWWTPPTRSARSPPWTRPSWPPTTRSTCRPSTWTSSGSRAQESVRPPAAVSREGRASSIDGADFGGGDMIREVFPDHRT